MMKRVALCLAVLMAAYAAHGATWYVDKANASGTQDGASWATAFTTIQPAIDAADGDGGDVWIAGGVYDETRINEIEVGFEIPLVDTGSLVMAPGVNLYGGFVGSETELAQRDGAAETIIDGAAAIGGTDPAHHVVIGADNAILDSCTIQGGVALSQDYLAGRSGGGLYFEGGVMTISNCLFQDNEAGGGAGAAFYEADVLVTDCDFLRNDCAAGGGSALLCDGGTVADIDGCLFLDNISRKWGAVTAYMLADVAISNSKFVDNLAGSYGGAIYVQGATAYATNCSFFGNSTATYPNDTSDPKDGGAIAARAMGKSAPTVLDLMNCSFGGNTATGAGGAVYVEAGVEARVANSILWGDEPGEIDGEASVSYSDIQGGYTGAGNLDLDPMYRYAAGGDFQLDAASPCIDAGTATGAPADALDGTARPQGDGYDMGAFERAKEAVDPSDGCFLVPGAAVPKGPSGGMIALWILIAAALTLPARRVAPATR